MSQQKVLSIQEKRIAEEKNKKSNIYFSKQGNKIAGESEGNETAD